MKTGWLTKKVGEVVILQKIKNNKENLPYVGMEDIQSNTGVFTGSLKPKKVKSLTFYFSNEHILYGRLRPYLNKVLLADFEGHCSTEVFPIRAKDTLSKDFFFYWITSDEIVNKINKTCTGARMPRANMKAVLDLQIMLPSVTEQKRIVKILDEVFEKLARAKENAEKNLQNSKELFESYLNNIFANPGKDWAEKKLNEACDIKHGFAFTGSHFKNNSNQNDPIVLTPGNFSEEGGLYFTQKNTKRLRIKPQKEFIFLVGDLVIVMTDLSSKMKILGNPAIIESNNILHNQRIGRVIFKNAILDKNYLFFYFVSSLFKNKIKETATGTMVKHTAPNRILSNTISFPKSISEQKSIVKKLDALSVETKKLEKIYEQKLADLEELKKSVLSKAFRGEL